MEILAESSRTQVLGEPGVGEPHAVTLAADHVPRDPAADCRELPFQLSDASLTGVVAHQPHPGTRWDRDRLRPQAVGGDLFRQQMLATDLDLLLFAVTRDLDDFHAVAQWPRHGGHA